MIILVKHDYEKITKHLYRQHRKYRVMQNNHVYGVFNSEEEARNYLEKLTREGVIRDKKRGRPISKEQDRYIKKTKAGTYSIQKHINGVRGHFGTYRTLEDAREERDYLESIDWDYSNME